MTETTWKLDAPYYSGSVSLRPSDVQAAIWEDYMSGRVVFILKGSGARVAAVANRKAEDFGRAAGYPR